MTPVADAQFVWPLTSLLEEERLFQQSIRQFARERLAPHVRAMDAEGVFRKDLLAEMFALGLMAVDVKEEYGGQGGSFFQSILAIEEVARVDPAASVIVDVQNTLVNNAIERWGTAEQKKHYLSRLSTHGWRLRVIGSAIRLRRLCAGNSRRSGGRSLPLERS